jgi:hypothetical protein
MRAHSYQTTEEAWAAGKRSNLDFMQWMSKQWRALGTELGVDTEYRAIRYKAEMREFLERKYPATEEATHVSDGQ